MKTLTLEQLAEKLNGNIWEKGDKKRIYLNRGFNTKKMSTKTYIELSPSGMFDVKCFIDCPSQPYSWIESQQEEIIENVENEIKEELVDIYYYIVNNNNEIIDDCQNIKKIEDLYIDGGLYISESKAKRFLSDEDIDNCKVVSISIDDFEKKENKFIESRKKH